MYQIISKQSFVLSLNITKYYLGMHNGAYGMIKHKIYRKVHWQFVAHISTCHSAQLPDTVSSSAADCVIAADRPGCSSFVWTIRPRRPGMEMFLSLTIHQSHPDNRMGLGKSAGILLRQLGTRAPLPVFKYVSHFRTCLLPVIVQKTISSRFDTGTTVTTFQCPFYIFKVDFYIFRRKYEWFWLVQMLGSYEEGLVTRALLGCFWWLQSCC